MIEFAPNTVPAVPSRAAKPVLVEVSTEAVSAGKIAIKEPAAPIVAVAKPAVELLELSSEDPAPKAVKRRVPSARKKNKDDVRSGAKDGDTVAPLLLNLEVHA